MKIRVGLFVVFLLVCVGMYVERGALRESWQVWRRPVLPVAQPYVPRETVLPATTTEVVAPIVGTTTKKKLPKVVVRVPSTASSTRVDPFAEKGPLPDQVNLAVLFLSQAPKQNWNMPYQEACEEASMLMVDAFYRGRTDKFTPSEGDQAILDLVSFEEQRGKTPDLHAAEVAEIAMAKWGYDTVVTSTVTPDLVKRALANGYPVILPADGKVLPNPNFRNGGPPYHMLVIKGYIDNRSWITNDPGTRLGANFIYPYAHLLNAAHDWNGGDVPRGQPVLIVLVPRIH